MHANGNMPSGAEHVNGFAARCGTRAAHGTTRVRNDSLTEGKAGVKSSRSGLNTVSEGIAACRFSRTFGR